MMGNLSDIYEREFYFRYYLHMTTKDIQETPIFKLEWMHNRLASQKKDIEGVSE